LTPGTHRISFQAEGFISTQERFFFKAKEVKGIQINIIPNVRATDRNRSIVVIKSEPDSAEVYIDNELYGSTPYLGKLIPGRYKIELKREKYVPYEETVVLKQAETLPMNIKLELETTIAEVTEESPPVTEESPPVPVESSPVPEETTLPWEEEIPDRQAERPIEVPTGKSKTWLYIGGGAILIGGAAAVLFLGKGGKNGPDQQLEILPDPPQYP
jgi:hypothetical protein